MKVTKEQILNGIINYAKAEIIDKITDKALKMMLAVGVSALEINPSIAEPLFNNDAVSKVLSERDGLYDVDSVFAIIEQTMIKYGEFPITIPAIKFVSPTEKELTFSVADVTKLKKYITDGGS